MKEIKTYRYPLWLKVFVRIVQLFQLGVLLGVAAVITIMIIILNQWGMSIFELIIAGTFGLCFIAVAGSFYLASFLSYPNIEIAGNQLRIRNLFLSSNWIELDEIIGVEYKLLAI